MPRLLDRLPVPANEHTWLLRSGERLAVKSLQPVVWISVTAPQAVELPPTAPRFPAVVDTGFNQTLLIQDWQLRDWGGVDAADLQEFPGESARYGVQTWPFRIADIWLHPNHPGNFEIDPQRLPFCLETHPGILVVSEAQRRQRLPVLGLRALAWNRMTVQLEFESPATGFLSLDAAE